MSALAKPLIHPTGTIDSLGQIVNVEDVESIDTVDVPAVAGAAAVYKIIFTMRYNEAGGTARTIEWKYSGSSGRNTSLANIKTLASNAIA